MAGRRTDQPLLATYIKIMLAFFIAFSGWAIVFVNLAQPAKAATGDGTPANPYIITTAEELANIRTNLSASYKLGDDIDLSDFSEGEGWEPIGSEWTYHHRAYDQPPGSNGACRVVFRFERHRHEFGAEECIHHRGQ
ncbi:hypothetical protein ACTID9_23445 [Brevibacillus fluminis]|uniref:hypothetical protein n=1 Tax=Brevibacillus fluminis TaxID=511487 RepID=UPI003F895C17